MGFRFEAEGIRISYVVDLGTLTTLVKEHLRDCDCILIEANYELEVLKNGPYPWEIKQRIWLGKGHLSNQDICKFVEEDFDGAARHLVLAHLSENNNSPELVRMAIEQSLEKRRERFPLSVHDDFEVHVCPRNEHLPTLRF